jgi:hypothetical protein
VPSYYFRAHFGRSHFFRLSAFDFDYYDGYPCYYYDDYRISFVDPCPEYWGDDWYESDDCYIDYVDDGYYLYNRRFPDRPGVAISIDLRF